MPTREELGRRLKSARTEKGLTLKEVELLSGVSMTHTSQIERGMTSPTVGALEKLARALDKSTSHFIEDSSLDDVCHMPKGDRNALLYQEAGLKFSGLTAGIARGMLHFYHVAATPVIEEPELRSHSGEEGITVVKGSMDVIVGEKRYKLKVGDSIHFLSSQPHAIFSTSRVGAEAIWAGTASPVL